MSRETDELGEAQHYEQFLPDLTSEPPMWTPEELALANAELERQIREPFVLTEVDI